MSRTICFYNNGTLDKRAFTMMGLSAKTDDKAIGFFGTGFKYAIATILRHGCEIRVVAEDITYDFHAATGKFRGKEHNFVYCTRTSDYGHSDEEPIELPFTTHLGTNWKLWQAYRELFTNAKDEGGGVKEIILDDLACTFKPGDVNVYVTGNDFAANYDHHDKYFLDAESVVEGYRMRAVERHYDGDNVVYYKTMYTGTRLDKPAFFTYDYTQTVELTEDRTLADTWYLRRHIGQLWIEDMSTEQLIEYLPKISNDKYYENNIDTGYDGGSEAFQAACAYLNEHNRPMPMWARDVYMRKLPFDQQVEHYTPTRFEQRKLLRALTILAHHHMVIDPNKIITCGSLPNDVMGYYSKGIIYIAKAAFERGFEKLLGTLYEEYLHLNEGVDDMSRAMQNMLVDKVAALMEQVYEMELEDTRTSKGTA